MSEEQNEKLQNGQNEEGDKPEELEDPGEFENKSKCSKNQKIILSSILLIVIIIIIIVVIVLVSRDDSNEEEVQKNNTLKLIYYTEEEGAELTLFSYKRISCY